MQIAILFSIEIYAWCIYNITVLSYSETQFDMQYRRYVILTYIIPQIQIVQSGSLVCAT